MLLPFAVLVVALPLAVLGGEFPVHNGVVGGAPTNVTVDWGVSDTLASNFPAQAGGLRYVENSGVCGRAPPLSYYQPVYSSHDRNHPRSLHSFRLRGPDFYKAHVVLVLRSPQQPRRRTTNGLVEWRGEPLRLFNLDCSVLSISKPGSSSMIGLFQEHGPCLINNDSSTVRLNPESWNQNSNV